MGDITVLVADDHPAFRDGLCHLLSQEPDMVVVGSAADGVEATETARNTHPDVAIVDVAMPPTSGIEAAASILGVSPDTRVLMLSAYDYKSYVLASLHAGAAGYMLKSAPVPELMQAIRLVSAGEAVFNFKATRDVLQGLATPVRGNPTRTSPYSLTQRELEVLRMMSQAATNRRIASQLAISERTVQTHVTSVLRKLNVTSRTEAVLLSLRLGLVQLHEAVDNRV